MKHIMQPLNTKICGQCCIAMATGANVRNVIYRFGNKSTRTWVILMALRQFGAKTNQTKLKACKKDLSDLPAVGILKVRFPGENMGHWIFKSGDEIYDPAFDKSFFVGEYLRLVQGRCKITSYIEILKD